MQTEEKQQLIKRKHKGEAKITPPSQHITFKKVFFFPKSLLMWRRHLINSRRVNILLNARRGWASPQRLVSDPATCWHKTFSASQTTVVSVKSHSRHLGNDFLPALIPAAAAGSCLQLWLSARFCLCARSFGGKNVGEQKESADEWGCEAR